MRVGFVITTLGFGGAERVLSLIANRLSCEHSVDIIKFDNQKPFYEIEKSIKIINLPALNGGFLVNLKKRFSKIFALRKIFKSSKYDIIISFMDSTNLLCLMANLGSKQRLIITEHSHHSLLSWKWKIAKRLLYPLCDGLSVLSRSDYQYYSYVKNRSVIYNPFFGDIDGKSQDRKENLILFVGRLENIKGCDIFLNSLKYCNLGNYAVEICGDGGEFKRLKDEFSSDKIKFLGRISDIQSHYKRAKIIVSSSRNEGLGNALIEACFYKVARVATPTIGACELICDGEDGLISDDFSPKSLAKKLNLVINDENLRDKLAKNGFNSRAKFGLENIYQDWLNLINKAIK
ncbi:glycosyltransferase [Campylobacter sp. CX2-8023-23]|uniref:glycosyltransferase n=1 Tax=Campylobacter porcelli TaxID=1660073 RepID=UPI002EB0416D|nr:glycosyltransferase [Campylobacter sp. CX2-8023-23]